MTGTPNLNKGTSEAPQDVAALPQTEAGQALMRFMGWGPAWAKKIRRIELEAAAGLLDQNDRLRSALHSCGLAAHFGGELMDQRHRGGRDKLRYIEIMADAALRDVPPVFPSGAEEADPDDAYEF